MTDSEKFWRQVIKAEEDWDAIKDRMLKTGVEILRQMTREAEKADENRPD